ncbi:MAG: Dabb family protein [Chloroflexota bacterium]
MIRHMATATLRPDASEAEVEEFLAAVRSLRVEGMLAIAIERGLGTRDGDADLGLVADFEDAEAFARYDRDTEHIRIRRDLAARILDGGSACQIRID